MKNNERYKRLIKTCAAVIIVAVEVLLYWCVWTGYYNRIIEIPFWRRGNWLIVGLYGAILLFFLNTYGGLRIGYLRHGNLIYSQMLSIVLVNIFAYLELVLIDKKLYAPWLFLLLTAVDFIVVVAWVFIFQAVYATLFPPRTLLVVYGDKPVFSIWKKFNSRDDKYVISGAISLKRGIDNILNEAGKYGGVIVGDIPSHERNIIIKGCYDQGIRAYAVPKLSDILMRSATELNLFDTQLLLSKNEGPQIDQLFIKRVLDMIIASMMLIITLPIFVLAAIAIYTTDRGPIFFRQKRLTVNGKEFDILKFRSMVVDAEKDGVARLAGQKDHRITKVGKILRSTRLDELPQLLNILRGEMSMVGPRPERPEIAAEYKKEIPEFDFRLKMKAGLTGYAQVYGKYNTTPYDKLKLDLTYIRNYSVWLDLKLMILTPKILFIKESTEGIEDDALNALIHTENLKEEIYGKVQNLEEKIGRNGL